MSKDLVALKAELAKLQEENEKLKAKAVRKQTISFKVSEKGAVSVYGLGRFPVTLYSSQWNRLIEKMPELKAFLEANVSTLTTKE
jgi:ribosome-interacting GTPase 1